TGRAADRIDFLEKDALSFKAVDRNSDDFVCHDDGGVTAKVRAVDRYAIPGDGAEAAVLRAGRSVFHAADGCFESRQSEVGRARSNADIGSANAGKLRRRSHAYRVAGRQRRIRAVNRAITSSPQHRADKTGDN